MATDKCTLKLESSRFLFVTETAKFDLLTDIILVVHSFTNLN